MTSAARWGRLNDRDRLALGAALTSVVAGALIWLLWVLPVATSVDRAAAHPLGEPAIVELDAGQRVGIWGSGISANLGTMACTVNTAEGEDVATRGGPALVWSDTLWWMTPKWGFEQSVQFTALEAGMYRVSCADSLDTYDGEFLVAGDSFGGGSVGLGRHGGSDFAVGSVLAFGAVFCPLFAVLLPIVIGIRLAISRRRASSGSR
ncbi:hypothetical protein KZC51_08985 [Microbacterium sp. SSW1-49]|uniref:Ig-like domain-containing protein n=1 Tax=Microbacterium croceum TaxID=2851645 RepID=A0ABT0FEW8_9MICO|nr:hypothetical protein [Microbacterium croceum]MCK2036271.1 hypothetical protein [Microbacterium croceum]